MIREIAFRPLSERQSVEAEIWVSSQGGSMTIGPISEGSLPECHTGSLRSELGVCEKPWLPPPLKKTVSEAEAGLLSCDFDSRSGNEEWRKIWKSQGEDRITAGPGWTGSQKAEGGRVPGRGVAEAMEAALPGRCLLRAGSTGWPLAPVGLRPWGASIGGALWQGLQCGLVPVGEGLARLPSPDWMGPSSRASPRVCVRMKRPESCSVEGAPWGLLAA